MLEGLVAGSLFKAPEQRIAKNSGRSYVNCMVRTTMRDNESLMVSVTAFGDDICRCLMALGDGDAVALAGSLTVRTWIDKKGELRPSLDMVANQLLTSYHLSRKRKSMQPPPPETGMPSDHIPF